MLIWMSMEEQMMGTADHTFKNLLASCLFSFFVKLCGIFVFTYEGVA